MQTVAGDGATSSAGNEAGSDVPAANVILRFALACGVVFAVLGLSAGRWDVPQFIFYASALLAFACAVYFGILRKDLGLLQERFRTGAGDHDRWTRPLMLPMFASVLVVAGLDLGRFRWSGDVPAALMALGFATQFAGMAGWYWPMSVNRFFSAQVRVQQERGHHVIDVGPYAIVRHPGYASFFIMILGMPLALGSYVASIPASAIGLVFIRRVITEDRFLEANLPGYAEYAQRVRFRIVPGVW